MRRLKPTEEERLAFEARVVDVRLLVLRMEVGIVDGLVDVW